MKLIWRFIRPHWKLFTLTVLLLVIDVAGSLLIPYAGSPDAEPRHQRSFFPKTDRDRTVDGRGFACLRHLRHPWRICMCCAIR